jgi:hypothetical protein
MIFLGPVTRTHNENLLIWRSGSRSRVLPVPVADVPTPRPSDRDDKPVTGATA